MKSVLFLVLRRSPFEQIANGTKWLEFREAKPFWVNRLRGKRYEEIDFQNGYRRNAPRMRVMCLGIAELLCITPDNPHFSQGEHYFAIRLGRILQLKNWPCRKPSNQSSAQSNSQRSPDSR